MSTTAPTSDAVRGPDRQAALDGFVPAPPAPAP